MEKKSLTDLSSFNSLLYIAGLLYALLFVGKVLNVETQDMKFKTWSNEVDPDKSYWSEYGKETVFYLNVIRLFYESGPPAYEEIG